MLRAPSDDLTSLYADAEDHATAWEFFALVRAIEQLSPDAPRMGTALDPGEEPIDLAHEPSLTFPRTTVAGFDRDRRRPRVRSYHLGLTGPMGPMPVHVTELAMFERAAKGTNPLGDFFDMVSTRMLQGFYRAWASGDPCAQADRPADDDFASYLGAVSGATSLRFVTGAERGSHDEGGFGDWRRLAYGGHLSGLRSAAAVGDLLGHALERPVGVDETVGRWRDIPRDARTRIGRRGMHNRLGTEATLGGRFYAVEWDVAIRVRASSMDDLERLLPGGEINALLVEAAEVVLPDHVDWHARIEVGEVAVSPAKLGVKSGTRPRLGMTAWVSPKGDQRMRNDVRLASRASMNRPHDHQHIGGARA